MTAVRVRFGDSAPSILSRLDVEAPSSCDLLGKLMRALFDLRIQVVSCQARVDAPKWSATLSLVEFDGAPIGVKRRGEVQAKLLAVIEQTLIVPSLAARQRALELEVRSG